MKGRGSLNGAVSHLPRVQDASFSSKAEEGDAEGSRDSRARRMRLRRRRRGRGRAEEKKRRVAFIVFLAKSRDVASEREGASLASGRGSGRDAGSRSLLQRASPLRARRSGGGDPASGEEPERGLPGAAPCFRDGPGLGGDGRGGDGEGAGEFRIRWGFWFWLRRKKREAC
jgi:hypothetical protein